MHLRPLVASDHDVLAPVLDDWWGGRPVRQLLPRLFFEHFTPTSFVLEDAGAPCAFLVGFRSQAQPHVAYIHFVGVAPPQRGRGLGRRLYATFFERAAALGCTEVRCITAPVNTGSVAFHRRLGFEIVAGDAEQDGLPVHLDHGGPGQHRVLFRKVLAADTVAVRAAAPADKDRLLDIWLRAVRATHGFLGEQDIQALLPVVRDVALEQLELWELCENEVPVGFMGLAGAAVEALFIDPAHSRRGGGRRLLDQARRLKGGPLRVDVNEQNPAALAFYRACGFVVAGRSPVDGGGRPFPLLHLREVAGNVDDRVSLREITADTLRAVLRLSVADTQEGFVATNAISLAQALFAPEAWYRAICCDEDPVGFVMLEDESLKTPAPPAPEIGVWRLMIDRRYQGRGIGRAAMLRVVDHVRATGRFRSLLVSYVPGPGSPEGFYRGLGFRPNGQVIESEIILELPL